MKVSGFRVYGFGLSCFKRVPGRFSEGLGFRERGTAKKGAHLFANTMSDTLRTIETISFQRVVVRRGLSSNGSTMHGLSDPALLVYAPVTTMQ